MGAGESVEFAYKLGCSVIQLDGIPEHLTPISTYQLIFHYLWFTKIELS